MRCLSLAAERQEVNRSQVDKSDALPGRAARAANCHDDMRWLTLDPRDAWWCAPPTTRNPRHTTASNELPVHGGGMDIVRHADSCVCNSGENHMSILNCAVVSLGEYHYDES